jgi:GTP-binding protein Era
VILALNKIDMLSQKELVLEKIQKFADLFPFEHIVPISALTGDGVPELLALVEAHAAPGPHFFDDDAYTDQPERVIAAEIIREKLLRNLRDEIPHGVAVAVEDMKERDSGLVDLSATIFCEKTTHKGIIIGKQGAMLKKIATESRHELERFLGVRVNLQCWVKIKEDWRNREGMLREIGFR